MRIILFCLLMASLNNGKLAAQSDSIILIFGGDCAFVNHFERFVKDDYLYPFKKLDVLRSADISMINLENPISRRGDLIPKEFNFRMNPKYIQTLIEGGIDIVTAANNHIFDYGKDALFDTMRLLDSAGIKYVGIGKNIVEARKPVIFNLKNKKIAFLGYFGSGMWHPATKNEPGTVPRLKNYIKEDIQRVRDSVDFIIVNYHWGEELEEYPNEYQKDLAHFTIKSGADVVIGHHPHVLQGVEKINNRFVVYSLGNFIFGGNSRKEYSSMLFKLTIINDRLYPELLPIRVKNWQAFLLEGNEKDKIIDKVNMLSRIFKNSIFSGEQNK